MPDAVDAIPLRSALSIQEFQVDLLLKEEFSVDPAFAALFMRECGLSLELAGVARVVHSLNDAYGEADLLVQAVATTEDGRSIRLALLIEDKINASFQPGQAARYRKRGIAGELKDWDTFKTVLVAPQAYIHPGHGFDAAIPLERIMSWFCPGDPERAKYKSQQIQDAIDKKSATGVQIVDPAMTSFRHAYYDHLVAFNQREGTDFSMRPPTDTYWGDYWFYLGSLCLPGRTSIRHMAPTGTVELQFKQTPLPYCNDLIALLKPDMHLIATGKYHQHIAVRLSVPGIPVFDDFARDQEKVDLALLGAKRLLQFFLEERAAVERIVSAARTHV